MITTYVALTEPKRISFLADLSWTLTVLARDTYAAGSENVDQPVRLRAFNEGQHQVTQHLRHVLEGRRDRYPEDTFAEMLCEIAAELGFERRLAELLAKIAMDSPHVGVGPRTTGRVA